MRRSREHPLTAGIGVGCLAAPEGCGSGHSWLQQHPLDQALLTVVYVASMSMLTMAFLFRILIF